MYSATIAMLRSLSRGVVCKPRVEVKSTGVCFLCSQNKHQGTYIHLHRSAQSDFFLLYFFFFVFGSRPNLHPLHTMLPDFGSTCSGVDSACTRCFSDVFPFDRLPCDTLLLCKGLPLRVLQSVLLETKSRENFPV